MKKLIVIGGATATGKTTLAIELARRFGTEVVSADSRQFYREMSIGTAKPSAAELAAVPHHFVNHLSIHDSYTVGDYETDALRVLELLFQKKDVAVLVGGSGLFIRAVCEGLDAFPNVPDGIVTELEALLQSEGISALQAELARLDPAYFHEVDRNNPQRLLRALAVCRASGQPYSSFRTGQRKPRPFVPAYLLLEQERALLYHRINDRVDRTMATGLLEEAKHLYPHRQLKPLQTVGYQELFKYFDGKTSLEQAVLDIKQNTRNYAKRQATWFQKHGDWQRVRSVQEALMAL